MATAFHKPAKTAPSLSDFGNVETQQLSGLHSQPQDSQVGLGNVRAIRTTPGEEHKPSFHGRTLTDEDLLSAPVPKARRKSWRFMLAFLALAIVAFVSSLDATTLSVALPIIAEDLHATTLQSFWAGISFLLTSVLFQPVHTIFSDIFGRKQVLYYCMVFFGSGSIIIGAAPNMTALIAGRTIQGIGGGGLEVLSEIILTDMTTLKERPLYLGLLGFVLAAGTVLGPIVGGVFSEYVSWRWIAWINLPFLGIAVVLVPFFMKLKPPKQSLNRKFARIDWIGILLFFLGLTSFILAITWGGALHAWTSLPTLLPLLGGICILILFGLYESRPQDPIIPYRMFATPTRAIVLFGAFLHGILLYSVLFYLPLYFEASIQHRPLSAAVDSFPMCFTLMPFAIITAFAIELVRRYRWSVWTAWTLAVVGMGLLTLLRATSNTASRTGYQILAGVGMGALFPALTIPMQASVPEDDVGLAMGMFVFARQMGGVVGVALGSAVFTNVFAREIKSLLPLPAALEPLGDANAAIDFIPKLQSLVLDPVVKGEVMRIYARSIEWIWVAMVVVAGIGLVTSFFVKELTLEKEAVTRQAYDEAGDRSR